MKNKNIRECIIKIGENANKFKYEYGDLEFNNITVYYGYDNKIRKVTIEDPEAEVVFLDDILDLKLNNDEKKFLNRKFKSIIKKIQKKEEEEEKERLNRIINSIKF